MRKWKNREGLTGLLFLLPSLLGVCLFVLIPFADVVRRSFASAITEEWVGLKNYGDALGTPAFRLACRNTLRFLLCCMPPLLILSLLIGVFLQQERALGQQLKNAFLFPMAIPVASVALVWQALFHQNGLINGLCVRFGASPVNWMNSPAAFWVLVGSYLWKNLGYDIVLWMAGLSGIPEPLYEAARIDGAGALQQFWYVTVPNIKNSLALCALLRTIDTFRLFEKVNVLTGGGPANTTSTITQYLYNYGIKSLDFGFGSAGAIVMTVLVLILSSLYIKRAMG